MIILEVAFVLVNLAVPYWVWTSKTTSTLPQVEHEALKKTLWSLSETQGGFAPCDSNDVVFSIDDLCEKSRRKWTEKESTAFERATSQVIFSCEVRKDEIRVQWIPDTTEGVDMKCAPRNERAIAYGPLFVMNLRGQLRRIEYANSAGGRDIAPMRNCRLKLKKAQTMTRVPASDTAFLQQLGQMPNDPSDYLTGNMICLDLDPHKAWDPFRKRYGQ